MMTKTVLNRLVALLSVIMLTAAAMAQNAQYIIVTQQDGTKASFELASEPVLTLSDGMLTVTTEAQTLSVPLAEVVNYTFSDQGIDYTAIDDVKAADAATIAAGKAHFQNLQPGTLVGIYTVDGRQVGSATAAPDGTVNINLNDLGTGIYILTTPTASYKIYNR